MEHVLLAASGVANHESVDRLNNIRARGALAEQFGVLMKAGERRGATPEDLEWLRAMKRQVQADMASLLSVRSSAPVEGHSRDGAQPSSDGATAQEEAPFDVDLSGLDELLSKNYATT